VQTVSVKEGRLEAIVAGCLVALGVMAFWGALQMPVGSPSMPGAGFFPRVLSLALVGVGVIILVRRHMLTRSGDPDGATPVPFGHRHIVVAFLATCAAAALFEPAGFLITSVLYLFVMLRMLSPLGWLSSIAAAVIAAVASHLFFVELLRVPLPGGLLNF
jgi:putative tricarboxylic transport membrane protein